MKDSSLKGNEVAYSQQQQRRRRISSIAVIKRTRRSGKFGKKKRPTEPKKENIRSVASAMETGGSDCLTLLYRSEKGRSHGCVEKIRGKRR